MIILKFHSYVDIITNSSTVIYSWYENSVSTCKELINSFLSTFNIPGTSDDYFYVGCYLDPSRYLDSMNEEDIMPIDLGPTWRDQTIAIEQIIMRDLKGEEDRPEWMKSIEKNDNDGYGERQNDIYIEAKDPKYFDIAQKLKAFLHSPDNDASYN